MHRYPRLRWELPIEFGSVVVTDHGPGARPRYTTTTPAEVEELPDGPPLSEAEARRFRDRTEKGGAP